MLVTSFALALPAVLPVQAEGGPPSGVVQSCLFTTEAGNPLELFEAEFFPTTLDVPLTDGGGQVRLLTYQIFEVPGSVNLRNLYSVASTDHVGGWADPELVLLDTFDISAVEGIDLPGARNLITYFEDAPTGSSLAGTLFEKAYDPVSGWGASNPILDLDYDLGRTDMAVDSNGVVLEAITLRNIGTGSIDRGGALYRDPVTEAWTSLGFITPGSLDIRGLRLSTSPNGEHIVLGYFIGNGNPQAQRGLYIHRWEEATRTFGPGLRASGSVDASNGPPFSNFFDVAVEVASNGDVFGFYSRDQAGTNLHEVCGVRIVGDVPEPEVVLIDNQIEAPAITGNGRATAITPSDRVTASLCLRINGANYDVFAVGHDPDGGWFSEDTGSNIDTGFSAPSTQLVRTAGERLALIYNRSAGFGALFNNGLGWAKEPLFFSAAGGALTLSFHAFGGETMAMSNLPVWINGSSAFAEGVDALAGPSGDPSFVCFCEQSAGATTNFLLTNAEPGNLAFLIVGATQAQLPFAGGVLVPSLDLVLPATTVDASGVVQFPLTWSAGATSGLELYYQYWLVDPLTLGFSASNSMSGLTL